MIHVLPVGDSEEHALDTTCECSPGVECHAEILVAHNAFDGREQRVEDVADRRGWIIQYEGAECLDDNESD